MKQTIKLSDLKAVVAEAHEKLKGMKVGANADYSPFLAKIDPNLFGIAISCLLYTSSFRQQRVERND